MIRSTDPLTLLNQIDFGIAKFRELNFIEKFYDSLIFCMLKNNFSVF